MPGTIHAGANAVRSSTRNSTSSSLPMPSRRASAGETSAALSHVSCEIGFGSSCSHALFADDPSPTRGSGAERELDARPRSGSSRRGLRAAGRRRAQSSRLRAERRAVDDTFAQRRLQERREIAATLRVPVRIDEVASAARDVAGKRGEQLERRFAVVERRDAWLLQRDAAVEAAQVAPALERVRRGDLPLAGARRLVDVQPVVDAKRDLRERRRRTEDRRAPCTTGWCR